MTQQDCLDQVRQLLVMSEAVIAVLLLVEIVQGVEVIRGAVETRWEHIL